MASALTEPESGRGAGGPTLICIGGSPGAGKTTVGSLVARVGGMCLVDLDSVTTPLVEAFAAGLGVVADLDVPHFAALRGARYDCLGEVVSDNLRAGRDVVAVAPFTSEATDAVSWRDRGHAWGADRVVLCWLDVDVEVTANRLAERALPRDLAKADRAEQQDKRPSRNVAPASEGARREVAVDGIDVVADGTRPPEETGARILAAVGCS